METLRVIKNCNFDNCTCFFELGNDFADINSEVEVIRLYEIINIDSSSESIKFYFEILDLSLDCVIDNTCDLVGEVKINGDEGWDVFFCGSKERPCKTIDYGLDKRLKSTDGDGVLLIHNGSYNISSHSDVFNGINLKNIKYDDDDDVDENDYPVIYPSPSDCIYWFKLSSSSQSIGFTKLKLVYPSNEFSGFLFYLSSSCVVNLTNCYVVSNSSTVNPTLFQINGGYIEIINTTFHTLHFHDINGILDFTSPISDDHIDFTNCTFKSIISDGLSPSILSLNSTLPVLNITGCVFINISATFESIDIDASTTVATLMYICTHISSQVFYNNSFINIAGASSCLILNARDDFVFEKLIFINISSSLTDGGAISINSAPISSVSIDFDDCLFTHCKAAGGGILFIYFFFFFLFFFFFDLYVDMCL
jgi:hypothetical protein